MNWTIAYAAMLFVACALLLVAEVFVPSAGMLSLCALGCLTGGLILCFGISPIVGWTGIILSGVIIPVVLYISYRLFPKTRFGRAVTLNPPDSAQGDAVPDKALLDVLVGEVGCTQTPLHPVGICDFSGRRLECVAETGYVDRGIIVEVICVQGTQPTVRIKEEGS